jgi:hypothetical protein
VDVTINNQCSNIELTYPIHFIKDVICYGHFPQQVNSKNEMKINFKIGMVKSMFSGILLCHLQRKVDTSISTLLLVTWKFRIDTLYSHTYLIEHEGILTWNEDMLKNLYDAYNSQDDTELILNEGRWMLDNNTKLKIECEASYKGDFEMNVTISEEDNLTHPIKPLWVDPNR